MDDKPVIHVFIQDITERKKRENQLVRKDLDDMISKSNASLEVDDLPVVRGYATELPLLFQNLDQSM